MRMLLQKGLVQLRHARHIRLHHLRAHMHSREVTRVEPTWEPREADSAPHAAAHRAALTLGWRRWGETTASRSPSCSCCDTTSLTATSPLW